MREKILLFLTLKKTLIISGFIIIGVMVFVLFNLSNIYKYFYSFTSPYEYYGEKLKINSLLKDREPYVFFGKVPVLAPHVDKNFSFIFNDEQIYQSKQIDEFRIMIVGGSIASGNGVSKIKERFYKVLQKKLNKNSMGVVYRVFSAGMKDYVSGQTLMQLQLGLLSFKPDMIIYIDSYMDFIAHKIHAQPPGVPKFFLEYQIFLEIAWAIDTARHSYLMDGVEYKTVEYIESIFWSDIILKDDLKKRARLAKRKKFSLKIREINSHLIRNYARNLNSFFKIVNEYGIPALLIYPPIPSFKNKNLSSRIFNCNAECKLINDQFTSDLFKEFIVIGKKTAAKNKLKFISLINNPKNFPQEFFINFFSMNKVGQEIFGTTLYNLTKDDIYQNTLIQTN